MYLLFPGRHIVTTQFQEEYLDRILGQEIAGLPDLLGAAPAGRVTDLVFAVTSSNKSNSRYNPLPFELRSIVIYEFARQWKRKYGVNFHIVGIPHYQPTDKFMALMLKEIAEQTDCALELSPKNTVVLSSTPPVIAASQALGYAVLPAEYDMAAQRYVHEVPTDLVRQIGTGEIGLEALGLSASARTVFSDLPEAGARIVRLYNDPILTEDGDLTATRDYNTYASTMAEVIDLKYQAIKDYIVPGKIVDEGCADGALISRIVRDYPDSDIIGIDLSAEMLARAHEWKRAGAFGNAFVFFKQQNLTTPVTESQANTSDTVICNSTLHELWSYGHRAESVRSYLRDKYKQLRRGGRLVIRDVVGPHAADTPVQLWCSASDGFTTDNYLTTPSSELSTFSRFLKFQNDFSPRPIQHAPQAAADGDAPQFTLPLRDAMEFITKMEYTDNWASEMHEEFGFWSFADWERELIDAGFALHPASHAYVNDWRVEHIFMGHVGLFDMDGKPLAWPVTNMVLVGEKGLGI
jgi:ubiquinone/menaquinone biosynthesis C-methylase UbiE